MVKSLSNLRLQQAVLDQQPRLFECSNKTGRFIATEVTHFTQDDLSEDDVMLLDTWDQVCKELDSYNLPGNKNNDSANQNISPELGIQPLFQSSISSCCIQVFIWIGQEANEVERKESLITCREYLRTHPGARDPDTPIVLTKQGFEPPTFTGWFTAWDAAKWSVSISIFNRKNARKRTKKGVFLNSGGRTTRS